MRPIALLFAAALAGCATTTPKAWVRADGKPFRHEQLELDRTICRGEMQKANLSSTMEPGIVIGPNGPYSPRGNAITQVYSGCMAQHGYVEANPQ
jgi:hypothetical protein